jgi:hypothetical protein
MLFCAVPVPFGNRGYGRIWGGWPYAKSARRMTSATYKAKQDNSGYVALPRVSLASGGLAVGAAPSRDDDDDDAPPCRGQGREERNTRP